MTRARRVGSPMQRRCRGYAQRQADRRWHTSTFPMPPLPQHYLDEQAEANNVTPVHGWRYLMPVLKVNGSNASKAVRDGFNVIQAERWAAHRHQHPADIWGRLWWDVAELDARLNMRDERLAKWVETFPVIRFTPEFTTYVRSLRPTQKAAS